MFTAVLIPHACFRDVRSEPWRQAVATGSRPPCRERITQQGQFGRATSPSRQESKATSKDASYNQTTFYEAWRLTIQRYGIYNPYTGKGAIKGLLPHGPHNVRDVLATHVLKQTGSYEKASYAIQDTPEMVAQHYGRFLPQDKAALAAQVLNRVWESE